MSEENLITVSRSLLSTGHYPVTQLNYLGHTNDGFSVEFLIG